MKEGGTKNDNDTCKPSTKWRQGMGGRDHWTPPKVWASEEFPPGDSPKLEHNRENRRHLVRAGRDVYKRQGIERVVYSDKITRFTEDFNVQNDDKVQLYLRTTTESSYVRAGGLTVSIQIPFDKTSVVERTY